MKQSLVATKGADVVAAWYEVLVFMGVLNGVVTLQASSGFFKKCIEKNHLDGICRAWKRQQPHITEVRIVVAK